MDYVSPIERPKHNNIFKDKLSRSRVEQPEKNPVPSTPAAKRGCGRDDKSGILEMILEIRMSTEPDSFLKKKKGRHGCRP